VGAATAPHPLCLKDGELPLSPPDVCLGEIGGAPFYIDSDQYEHWGKPRFEIDVAAGAAEGFSIEGPEGVHFVRGTPLP
jgi:uncharacterized protein (DUF779 family)